MASVTQWLAGASKAFGGQYQWDQQQRGTDGAAHVKTPDSFYGQPFAGEASATATGIALPAGVTGITLSNSPKTDGVYGAAAGEAQAYVAFNNHPLNDSTVAGLRYTIPPFGSITITFSGTPLPTTMELVIGNTDCLVSWVGGAS